MNNCNFSGRLTKDPVVKTFGERTCTNFTIAVKRNFSSDVDFINCQGWNGKGKYIADYAKKGDYVVVSGELRLTLNSEKNERYITLIVDSSDIGSSKKSSGDSFDFEETEDDFQWPQ